MGQAAARGGARARRDAREARAGSVAGPGRVGSTERVAGRSPPAAHDAARPAHARGHRALVGGEILWEARLSPYKRGADLEDEEAQRLREAVVGTLGAAIEHYERVVALPIPDKLPMPLRVHRHEGEPCPRCQATLHAVHFEDYVIAYCPACQTEGRCSRTAASRGC